MCSLLVNARIKIFVEVTYKRFSNRRRDRYWTQYLKLLVSFLTFSLLLSCFWIKWTTCCMVNWCSFDNLHQVYFNLNWWCDSNRSAAELVGEISPKMQVLGWSSQIQQLILFQATSEGTTNDTISSHPSRNDDFIRPAESSVVLGHNLVSRSKVVINEANTAS